MPHNRRHEAFFVEISEDTFDSLARVAHRERRPVRQQAAFLLEQVLQPLNHPATRGSDLGARV